MIPYPIYRHPANEQMQAEVILASRPTDPNTPPIITMRLRYPRIIHGEIMTHRMFSRNARSSRAVPVQTMLNEVRDTPFVPWHWGTNQKGMQAGADHNAEVHNWLEHTIPLPIKDQFLSREDAWLRAADAAVRAAEAFMEAGYHKQIPNRLLEPFSWIDTLVTSTNWSNFLWLRDHKDAEPHLQDLARLVGKAIDGVMSGNQPFRELRPGEWHLPYITNDDHREGLRDHTKPSDEDLSNHQSWLCKLSAARCARISYKPFDGDASYERELERYDNLVNSDRVHASPLEHQATPDVYFTGQELCQFPPEPGWEHPELAGNLGPGWIQYRKLIPNEAH